MTADELRPGHVIYRESREIVMITGVKHESGSTVELTLLDPSVCGSDSWVQVEPEWDISSAGWKVLVAP